MKRILVATGVLATLLFASLTAVAQAQSRDDVLKQIEAKRAELAALEKRYIAPAEEDRMTYAEFLRSPDTGLIRLLPREKFDPYVTKDKSLTIRGGGAYYSFSEQRQEYVNSTDLGLEQGEFSTGFAGANYGMLTSIGDVPLENVSLETPAARILAAHNAAGEEPQARIEQRRVSHGTTIEGTNYKNRLAVRLNTTYLVRTVNYGSSDVLVAFRVVRIDADDSVTILWKQLKKYPTPRLARN